MLSETAAAQNIAGGESKRPYSGQVVKLGMLRLRCNFTSRSCSFRSAWQGHGLTNWGA